MAITASCVVAVWLARIYSSGYAEMRSLDQQIEKINSDNAKLEQKQRGLEHRKHMLETDPLTIEIEARNRLKYTKKGETIYVVENWPI